MSKLRQNEPQQNSTIASAIEPHLHSSFNLINHQKISVDKEPVDEMLAEKILQAIEGFEQS
jgi:hypothetical protein